MAARGCLPLPRLMNGGECSTQPRWRPCVAPSTGTLAVRHSHPLPTATPLRLPQSGPLQLPSPCRAPGSAMAPKRAVPFSPGQPEPLLISVARYFVGFFSGFSALAKDPGMGLRPWLLQRESSGFSTAARGCGASLLWACLSCRSDAGSSVHPRL